MPDEPASPPPPSPAPAAPLRPSPWRPVHALILAVGLAIGSWAGWHSREPEVLLLGDGPIYLALSHSMEAGRYRDEYLLGAPLHAKYPPAFPAWLIAVRAVAGDSPEAVRATNLLLLALTALLLADALRRIASPWTGVAAAIAVAWNPVLLLRAGTVYSEPLFTALVTLSLWAFLVADQRGGARWRVLGWVAGVAAFLTRLPGILLLASLVGWSSVRARWRQIAVAAFASAALVAAWISYIVLASDRNPLPSYLDDLPSISGSLPAQLVRMARNAGYYFSSTVPDSLGLPTIPGTIVDNLLWMLVWAGLGAVGLVVFFQRWRPAALFLVGTGLLICGWTWRVDRFLVPVLPSIVGVIMVGGHAVARRLRPRWGTAGQVVLAVALSVSAITNHWERSARTRNCDRADPFADATCYPLEQRDFAATARLARDLLPPVAVIASARPASQYYLSGLVSIPLAQLARIDRPERSVPLAESPATHLMLTRLTTIEARAAESILLQQCRQLQLVARAPTGGLLLAIRPPLPVEESACSTLAAFAGDVPGTRAAPH